MYYDSTKDYLDLEEGDDSEYNNFLTHDKSDNNAYSYQDKSTND